MNLLKAGLLLSFLVGVIMAKDIENCFEKIKIVQEEQMEWIEHPTFKGLKSFPFLTNKLDGVDYTCMLSFVPKGSVVKKHTHESDEIIYVLEGEGTIFIESKGVVNFSKGSFLRIPKGVAHQPFVTKDITAFNIFVPYIK